MLFGHRGAFVGAIWFLARARVCYLVLGEPSWVLFGPWARARGCYLVLGGPSWVLFGLWWVLFGLVASHTGP